MENEWITISEAAARAGITPQAIYKRLNTNLKPFVKQVENRKFLHINALQELTLNKINNDSTQVANDSTNVEQPIETVNNPDLITALTETVEALREQLAVKDQQISDLNQRLNQALKLSSESHFMLLNEQRRALEGPATVEHTEYHEASQEPAKEPEPPKRSWLNRIFRRP